MYSSWLSVGFYFSIDNVLTFMLQQTLLILISFWGFLSPRPTTVWKRMVLVLTCGPVTGSPARHRA